VYKGKTVCLVLPCWNEEAGLAAMLPAVPGVVDEVIVVDNASADGSAAAARAHGARVVAEAARGYGHAYRAGFAAAASDIIITMDADDTYPLHAAPELVARLIDDDLDFITVRRMHLNWERSAELIVKFFGKKIIDFTASLLFMRMIHDTQSGMWVFRREILDRLRLTSGGMAFSEEIKLEAFAKCGARAVELPVKYEYRKRRGRVKLRMFRDGLYNLFFIFVKRLQLR
jgi:hypothetical protein